MDHRNCLDRVASTRRLGIGVQAFPGYVNSIAAPHTLDAVLISLILRGRGRHIIDQEEFPERGDASIAVTYYGQRHDIVTDLPGMDILNLYLDLDRLSLPAMPGPLAHVLPSIIPLHPRFGHRLNRITRMQLDDPAPFAACVLALQRELDEPRPGHEEAARLLFSHFLILCCRHALAKGLVPVESSEATSRPVLERLRLYLDRNYNQPLTLPGLARRCRLRPTYLCRVFKAYTGRRLFDYIVERRVQAAMLALRCTEDKVLGIALACGFNDLSYFNRTFKRLVGETPSGYRRRFVGAEGSAGRPPRLGAGGRRPGRFGRAGCR